MKKCKICNQTLELDKFHFTCKKRGYRAACCKNCYNTQCREKKVNETGYWTRIGNNRRAKHGERDKLRMWTENIKQRYNITPEIYKTMLEAQNGKCAICSQKETATHKNVIKKLAVDHCHTTGKVRGLLCVKCNSGLGKLKDSVELLKSAIQYLEKSKSEA